MSDKSVQDRALTWYLWLARGTFVLFLCSLAVLISAIILGTADWVTYILPGVIALVWNSNRLALERMKKTGNPWQRLGG